MFRRVVKRRNVLVLFATSLQEKFPVLHRDLLQRLQTVCREARRHHLNVLHALLTQHFEGFIGVWRQPRLAAEARLEGHHHLLRRQAEGGNQLAGGIAAALRVIIPFIGETLRDAVIGEQQQIRLAVFFKRRARAVGERLDVQLVIRVVANKGHARNAAASRQNARQLVPDGGHRRAGVLRVERQHHDMVHALRQQRVHRAFQ